jgi:hypothetical protein
MNRNSADLTGMASAPAPATPRFGPALEGDETIERRA